MRRYVAVHRTPFMPVPRDRALQAETLLLNGRYAPRIVVTPGYLWSLCEIYNDKHQELHVEETEKWRRA